MHLKTLFLLKPLFKDFYLFAPKKVLSVLCLMVLSGMTAGASILLIVPLLHSIGIGIDEASSSGLGVGQVLADFAAFFNISLALGYVLFFYLVIVLLTGLISYLNSIQSANLQRSFVVSLRNRVFAKLMQAEWQFLCAERSTDHARLLTNQVSSVGANVHQVLLISSQLISILIYTAISLILSPVMTGLAFLCAMLLIVLLLPINNRIHRSGRVELRSHRKIFNDVIEQLASLKMIKSYGAEPLFTERMSDTNAELENQQMIMARYSAFTRLVNLCGAAMIFTLLFYVAIQHVALPLSNLLVILFIFSRLMPKVSAVQSSVQRLIHNAPDYVDLLQKITNLEANKEICSNESAAIKFDERIRLESLCYQYPQAQSNIINGISVSIEKNQTIAITGASGAGKSTLTDLIAGLLMPSQGRICIDGIPLDESNRYLWRKHVAYVTQDIFLFHDSIRENLAWVANSEFTDEDIWQALTLASASDFIRALPEGLDTLIGDRGVKLSGGERQRLALARALLCKPKLLILDEATSALDRENEMRIRDALIQLEGKLTMIIIAHNETTIEHVKKRIELG